MFKDAEKCKLELRSWHPAGIRWKGNGRTYGLQRTESRLFADDTLCACRCTLVIQSKTLNNKVRQPLIFKSIQTWAVWRPDKCSFSRLRNELHSFLWNQGVMRSEAWRTDGRTAHPNTRQRTRGTKLSCVFQTQSQGWKRPNEAGSRRCVSLMLCWKLQSHSVHSTHEYTALSPVSGELTSRIETVRKEWRSSHLSNSPTASFLFPPVTLAHCNPGRMSAAALQCYFPRLWDGGEKHINKRISVIMLAFGGKWSILSAAVIRFCGSRKDFPSHSCISSGLTESLAFRTSFLFWFGNQSLIFTLLFYIPWTRVCWSKPDFLKEEKRRAPLRVPFSLWNDPKSPNELEFTPSVSTLWKEGGFTLHVEVKEIMIYYYWLNTHLLCSSSRPGAGVSPDQSECN